MGSHGSEQSIRFSQGLHNKLSRWFGFSAFARRRSAFRMELPRALKIINGSIHLGTVFEWECGIYAFLGALSHPFLTRPAATNLCRMTNLEVEEDGTPE